eukprot:TRINITY_DN52117_c0_g1_i1.p1 TRINITY_DN52117_c0_g1~~TRINITY_DN52117_c0_g1_i1.p1  ORF type:complete len:319 (-),score=54.00 TRINITY_DN52117_c0_g1_i1:139-1095(-)
MDGLVASARGMLGTRRSRTRMMAESGFSSDLFAAAPTTRASREAGPQNKLFRPVSAAPSRGVALRETPVVVDSPAFLQQKRQAVGLYNRSLMDKYSTEAAADADVMAEVERQPKANSVVDGKVSCVANTINGQAVCADDHDCRPGTASSGARSCGRGRCRSGNEKWHWWPPNRRSSSARSRPKTVAFEVQATPISLLSPRLRANEARVQVGVLGSDPVLEQHALREELGTWYFGGHGSAEDAIEGTDAEVLPASGNLPQSPRLRPAVRMLEDAVAAMARRTQEHRRVQFAHHGSSGSGVNDRCREVGPCSGPVSALVR